MNIDTIKEIALIKSLKNDNNVLYGLMIVAMVLCFLHTSTKNNNVGSTNNYDLIKYLMEHNRYRREPLSEPSFKNRFNQSLISMYN